MLRSLFKLLAPALVVMLFVTTINAATNEKFDHTIFHKVLQKYVDDRGYVNYSGLKADRADLDNYITALAKTSPVNRPALFPDRNAQLAYWINAYNAFTLRGVVDHYPIGSVRDVHALYGFFWRIKFVAGGQKMSLRTLENKIIRDQFHEPRIHFAIVCASEGCPRLSREAYLGEKLNEQLDAQALKFINEERNVKLDAQNNRVELSKIFDWFADDFKRSLPAEQQKESKDAGEYIKKYLTAERLSRFEKLRKSKIDYIEYDWRINDQARSDIAQKR